MLPRPQASGLCQVKKCVLAVLVARELSVDSTYHCILETIPYWSSVPARSIVDKIRARRNSFASSIVSVKPFVDNRPDMIFFRNHHSTLVIGAR